MRYLLDTHLLLWWLMDSEQLSHRARFVIDSPEADIAYSVASVWEIAIKHAIRRLDVTDDFLLRLSEQFFLMLPIYNEHAWAAAHLPFIHKDPFDRLLVAQAQTEKRTLLTVDQLLLGYGDFIEVV